MTMDVNAPAGDAGGLGAGAANTTPEGGAANSAPWFSTIQDADLRGWVEQAGYRDAAALAKSHKELMAFRGVPAERLAQIPENWENADQVNAFYEKLGRPKAPTDYGVQIPDGGDPDFYNFMLGMLHEGGANTRQVEGWVKKYQDYAVQRFQADQQRDEQQSAADIAMLRGEWGSNYDQLQEQARRAFRKYGGDEQQMAKLEASLGTAGFLKLFQRIGEQMGESSFVEGDPNADGGGRAFNMLSPDGARARKQERLADPKFRERYFNNDPAAVAEITRLQQMEAAGMAPPTNTVVAQGGRP